MKLFNSFSEWMLCVKSAFRHLALGLMHTGRFVIFGLASVIRALWRRSVTAVGNYPGFALGAFLLALLFVWMFTFACMRARAVSAESKLGTITYEYQAFKESHGYE